MLSILRSNQLISNAVFILYMLVLRLPYLWQHDCTEAVKHPGILGELLFGMLMPANKYALLAIQTIIVVLQAAILNSLINKTRMMRDVNLFPGFIWVIVVCLFPEYLCDTTLLFANLFLLLSVRELFGVYRKIAVAQGIFNTGFFLSIAIFFYPGYTFFIVAVMFGLQILRAPKFKEYLMLFSGLVVPVILISVVYFWQDSLAVLIDRQTTVFGFNYSFQPHDNGIFKLGFIILSILVCLLGYSKIIFKQSIQNIKYIEILYIILLSGIAMTFFIQDRNIEQFLSITLPVSVIGGLILYNISTHLGEMIHLLLIFIVYFWQFAPNF